MSQTKLSQQRLSPQQQLSNTPKQTADVSASISAGSFRLPQLKKQPEAPSGRSVHSHRKLRIASKSLPPLTNDFSGRSESKMSLFSKQTFRESPTMESNGRDESLTKLIPIPMTSQSRSRLLKEPGASIRSANRSSPRIRTPIQNSRSKLKFGLNNMMRTPSPPRPHMTPTKTPMMMTTNILSQQPKTPLPGDLTPGTIKVSVNPFQTTMGASLLGITKESLPPSPTEVNCKNNKFFALSGTNSNSDVVATPTPMFQNNNISWSDSAIKSQPVITPVQNRHEMLAQLRHKLREIQRQEVSASGRKRTVAAAAATAGGIDGAGHSTAALSGQGLRDKVRKQFQPSNPKTLEEVIQDSNTRSIKFLDTIILCTVLDNYIFGALVFVAAIAEIIIGWLYQNSCSAAPFLPTVLMLNGALNILEVYTRNLANNGALDYFIMTFFRLLAFFSFVVLMIMVFTVDPKVAIWNHPSDSEYYVSIGGIYYCQTVLYYFSYYLVIVCAAMITLIAVFGLICIIYMHNRAKADSGGSTGDSSHLSYHRYGNNSQK